MEQLRKLIRKIIKESYLLLEVGEILKQPENYMYHGKVGNSFQYEFYTKKENDYILFLIVPLLLLKE